VTATDNMRLTLLPVRSLSNACFMLVAKITHWTFTTKVRLRCESAYYVKEQHIHHFI